MGYVSWRTQLNSQAFFNQEGEELLFPPQS